MAKIGNRMVRRSKLASIAVSVVIFSGAGLAAQTPEGVPRDLARQRGQQISDVRYQLSYTLTPHAPSAAGHEDLHFRLQAAGTVILDFREGTIADVNVNGKSAAVKMENGHLQFPGELLKAGENTVSVSFTAPVAPAGKAITRFEDKDDGSEYVYTLFVPMDADMAFPCFDQPDLKARFKLSVSAPQDWTVISNTAGQETTQENSGAAGLHRIEFAETRPISTYLFAFAAGPFRKVHPADGLPGLYVRKSKLKRAEEEAPDVQQITADGIRYLADYFAQPFPFSKYDMVMLPGFAYGGMEHAGATFLREESVLFRAAPTHSDRLSRDILLLHELTHQWFGDLVTMRWFDDLWLKEGFAQYMAYHALADLKPNENVWKRFYQAIKPAAYAIDSTQGTTPIYQDIANLKDAKSAYGAIVYSKAPGVLKQFAFVLGEEDFRAGLRLYLKEHAYANAEWSDLVSAFDRVSRKAQANRPRMWVKTEAGKLREVPGKTLADWTNSWIQTRGMPQVEVEWVCSPEKHSIDTFILRERSHGFGSNWPIAMQVLLHYPDGRELRLRAETAGLETYLREATGKQCPDYVFANDQDYGYGLFLLDQRSRKAVMASLGSIHDVFERTLLWGALWDSVRESELDPREYVGLALRLLPAEKDEALAQNIIGRMVAALHRYMGAEARAQFVPKAEALAYDQMLHSPEQDMRIIWFRALRGVAETAQGRGWLKDLLNGKLAVPGVELRPLDRWNIVTSLVALNDPDASAVLAAEQERDPSGDGKKYAYTAMAARPDAKTKQQYFNEYLHDPARPEDWIEQSLGSFNYWSQSDLTLPYLGPALAALPQVKHDRKIFFVLGWLNAFIGGQQSADAQAQVHKLLDDGSNLDPDLKLKVLEVVDELDRTVRIRQRYK